MAKKYYRWKDENCNGINPEWVKMTPKEFYLFKQNAENRKRLFVEYKDIYGEVDPIIIEVTKSQFDEWNRDKAKNAYQRKVFYERVSALVSMEEDFDEVEELTRHDVIADESVNIENDIEQKDLVEKLHYVLKSLSVEEQDLVYSMFLSESPMTERDYANKIGVSGVAVHKRKAKILKKLKSFFVF